MSSKIAITLVDGVRIVVPDSLNLITPYVLLEQQDWFEDEIKFLRGLLQPGQKIIDIGANYGVYSLTMAKTVGNTGRVWAFEPASATARLLAEGIAINGFTHVVLDRSALSSISGTAQLSLYDNSEMNSLVRDNKVKGAVESVPLKTLDECMKQYEWQHIDFMKIDAEGEELNIIKGGARFLDELSPLIQYEIKADDDLHIDLVDSFSAIGYDSYRLVPGLNLLVPFEADSIPDGYLLNLFSCKRDRADQLAAGGFLLVGSNSQSSDHLSAGKDGKELSNLKAYDWHQTIGKMPYGAKFTQLWERTIADGNSSEVLEALSHYGLSRDTAQSPADRFRALEVSFKAFMRICESKPTQLRLASLARVARDYGARSLAVDALQKLGNFILQNGRVDPSEPFLAPGERFDAIPPGDAIGNWVMACALEESERLGSFSSFYSGASARQRIERICSMGYASEEMKRRQNLLQKRFGSSKTR